MERANELMEVKVFDPADERAMRAWASRWPKKEIVESQVYHAQSGGVEREVAVVLFVEELAVGAQTSGRPGTRED
ncbi:MAG TPA: hypothetical protein VIR34_05810 [Gemmatimonadaceae bacterium]